MSIKNTKARTSKAAVGTKEDKLKAKLKESHKKFLKEDFDEEEDFDADAELGGGMDSGLEGDAEGFGDEVGGDDDFGGDEEFNFDDEGGLEDELTPEQDEFVDSQVDELLDPAASILGSQDEEGDDDLSLTEDEEFDFEGEGGGEEDFDFEGGGEGFEDDDIDLEASGESLEDGVDGGIPTEIDSTFSADELQSIIDSPDTIDSLDQELTSTAVQEVPVDGEGFEDDGEGLGSLEESLLIEAELAREIKAEMKKLKESEVATTVKSLDFKEESKPDTEDTFAKVSDSAKGGPSKGAAEHKGAGSTKDMKQEIKEGAKKSAMIVKLAKQVLALQKNEAVYKKKEKELQLENYKLLKANGLLAAAGEKLDAQSRAKIVESFSKCKDSMQVNTLYKKIVGVIKEKARGTINEAVQGRRTGVKTFNRIEKESTSINRDQARANLLMGLPGSDEAYFS